MIPMRYIVAIALPLTLTTGAAAQGGIGGMIKRKVDKVTKTGDAVKNADQADGGSKVGFAVNDAVVASFQRGLQVEIDGRNAFLKAASALKTPEEYSACVSSTQSSPEAIQLKTTIANSLPDNATTEQMMNMISRTGAEMEALTARRCGADPARFYGSARTTAFEKAEQDGANEFGKVFGSDSFDSPELPDAAMRGHGPFASGEAPATVASIDPATALQRYRFMKEWPPPFCGLPGSTQQNAGGTGIHVPGSGTNISYVYTAQEAAALGPACDNLMKLLGKLP